MQPQDRVVPAVGEREFDYTASDLSRMGWSSILGGSVFALASTGMYYPLLLNYSRDPASVHGPLWLFCAVLALFAAVGIAIAWSGSVYTSRAANEKLILTPTDVAWIDRKGRERVRCGYDQVRHTEETVYSRQSNRRYTRGPTHHQCILATDAGRIVFTDDIAEYAPLRDYFLSLQTSVVDKALFHYRSALAFVVSAIVLPITAFVGYHFVRAYLSGELMSVNRVMQPTPIYAPLFVLAISSIFWFLLIYWMLQSTFERIAVSAGRVQWYGPTGRLRIDAALAHVRPGSFKKDAASTNGGTFRYSVLTPSGKIRWSDSISSCTDLVRIMQTAAENVPAGAAPPPTASGWEA